MKKQDTFTQKLLAILMDQGTISKEESKAMQKAFKESSKETFDDFLLEEGLVDEADLLEALAAYYEVPGFDVIGYFFDTHLLHMFPEDFLTRNACIPVELDENIIVVVASEPVNSLLQRIGEYVDYDIKFRVGIRRDIVEAVREFYDKPFDRNPLTEDYPDLRTEQQLRREEKQMEEEGGQEEFIEYEEEE